MKNFIVEYLVKYIIIFTTVFVLGKITGIEGNAVALMLGFILCDVVRYLNNKRKERKVKKVV